MNPKELFDFAASSTRAEFKPPSCFTLDIQTLHDCGIPEYMHGALVRFYENGISPGSFLEAVIDNDLRGACERADSTNKELLFNYVNWFYNHAPMQTWGYAGAVERYLKRFDNVTPISELCP